jgi:hypothetical protein
MLAGGRSGGSGGCRRGRRACSGGGVVVAAGGDYEEEGREQRGESPGFLEHDCFAPMHALVISPRRADTQAL